MKFSPVLLCLLFISVIPIEGAIPDSSTVAFIDSVQKLLFNDRFQDARSLCNNFINSHKNSLVGNLFLAGTLLGEMSDLEEPRHSERFRKLVDTSIALCNVGLKSAIGTDASYYYLWRGHAHAYRSLFESRFGSFTAALKHGFKVDNDYQNGLKLDSSLYDHYFGLGNYHYWKSVKAGFLRTIGFVNNDIEKGLRELRLAADSGKFLSEAARNSLIWIWLDRKEFDSVIVISRLVLEKYPGSRTLRWPRAAAYFKTQMWENAAGEFEILRNYFEKNKGNYYNLIECEYWLYLCYKEMAKESEADKILSRIDNYRSKAPRSTQKRQLAKLNFLRRERSR